jgi:hypothetical protein
MFGGNKRHILAEGTQALAVVTDVNYAKVAGMTVAQNYNYKLKLTLMVKPEGEAPFEAFYSDYFPQFAQPQVGTEYWVRYDPADHTKVELDLAQIAADNAAYDAQVAAQTASAVPADLAAGGILGRGAIVDVQKTQVGPLVNCAVTVGVRLVDGTDPYRANCNIPLAPPQAEKLVAGSTFVTVRADAHDHSRIAISLTEETPVVTVSDPRALEPPARALRDGRPCRVTVLAHQRQWLQTPTGEEFYAIKVRVDYDSSEFQVNQPVPAASAAALQDGMEFAAKRLVAEPNVLAIDWAAAAATTPVA